MKWKMFCEWTGREPICAFTDHLLLINMLQIDPVIHGQMRYLIIIGNEMYGREDVQIQAMRMDMISKLSE
jgi:hypothetical protein